MIICFFKMIEQDLETIAKRYKFQLLKGLFQEVHLFNVVTIANRILNIKFQGLVLSWQGCGLKQWFMSIILALERLTPKDYCESEASLGYTESSVPWTEKWVPDKTQPTKKQINKSTLGRWWFNTCVNAILSGVNLWHKPRFTWKKKHSI